MMRFRSQSTSILNPPPLAIASAIFAAAAIALVCTFTIAPNTAAADAVTTGTSSSLQAGAGTEAATVEAAESTQNIYRLYNMCSGEHLYTTNASERDKLVPLGWFYEGIGWVAPAKSNTPVYRLYNPYSGDHHYTVDSKEYNYLASIGWRQEGVGWYSDDQKRVPLYRAFNPYEKIGTHHFMAGKGEYDYICKIGWRGEGVGWYAAGAGQVQAWSNFNYNHLQIMLSSIGGGSGINTINCNLSGAQRDRINRFLDESVGFVAINVKTGKCIARNANARTFSASTIKAPFVAGLCKYDVDGLRDHWGQIYDIITYSSNEDYNDMYYTYGGWPLEKFAAECGVWFDYPYDTLYVDETPRELCKLWLGMHFYIYSSQRNAPLFCGFFGNPGYYKEGWMEPWTWSGQMYHIGGTQNNTVYAIMTRWERPDGDMWALRDALVDATQ